MTASGVDQPFARSREPGFDDAREGHARLAAARRRDRERLFGQGLGRVDSAPRRFGVSGIALDADERAAQTPGRDAGGPGAEKRIEHQIAGVGRGHQHPREQRLGLLRRMSLSPRLVLQSLRPGADRQEPVGTDLHVLVAGLRASRS